MGFELQISILYICGIIVRICGLLNFYDRTIFKGNFERKTSFNVCSKRLLTGKRREKIAIFYYAICLKIFCSTLCVKFEKIVQRITVALGNYIEKKNTDGANTIGSSSEDSPLKKQQQTNEAVAGRCFCCNYLRKSLAKVRSTSSHRETTCGNVVGGK